MQFLDRNENRLLVACLPYSLHAQDREAIIDLMRTDIDWEFFVDQATWHHVTPLVLNALTSTTLDYIPIRCFAALKARAEHSKRQAAQITEELVRVTQGLKRAGLEALAIKGPALSQQLYSNPTLRSTGDLDLLVRGGKIDSVLAVLAEHGYRIRRQVGPTEERVFRRTHGVYNIEREDGAFVVEAHWMLAQSVYSISIDHDALFERAEEIVLDGVPTATLALEDLPLTLCLHGVKDLWTRVKWVNDIAELLRSRPDLDWNEIHRRAKTQGCQRMLVHGLSLAHLLCGVPIPKSLAAVETDSAGLRMTQTVLGLIDSREPTPSTGRFVRYWFDANDHWRPRVQYALRSLFVPHSEHQQLVQLPDRLHFAYFGVRFLHDYVVLPCWLVAKWLRIVRRD